LPETQLRSKIFLDLRQWAVQALLANQIQFIFSIGPQMPAVGEGNDIMLPAQQVAGRLSR
jgi:hypothetical protein